MCIQIHTYTIYFTHTYILYLYVKLIAFILDLKKDTISNESGKCPSTFYLRKSHNNMSTK